MRLSWSVLANNRVKRDARNAGFGLSRRPRAGAPYPKYMDSPYAQGRVDFWKLVRLHKYIRPVVGKLPWP